MVDGIDLGVEELSDFQAIGTGGFSTVYSAWDDGFQRRVAVKMLHSLDEAGRRRFDRERGIMGLLSSHPNVIMPFRAGYAKNTGAPFLVMELVEGGSLQDLIVKHRRVPWNEAIDYIIPATAALGHAHSQGVLHRDVKPGNILLAGKTPKLTDFGIAAIRESTASQVAYTLAHCPPETFATGRDTRDERSDLYSIASTLFTLITGQPPFDVEGEDSQQAYMFRIIDHQLAAIPPELAPGPIAAFLARALSKDPVLRPQSAQEFVDELQQIRAELTAGGHPGMPTGGPTVFGPSGESITTDGAAAPTIVSSNLSPPGTEQLPHWPPPTTGPNTGPGTGPNAGPGTGPDSGPTSFDASPAELISGPSNRGAQPPTIISSNDPGLEPPRRRSGRLALLGGFLILAAALGGAGWWFLQGGAGDSGPPPVAWQFETKSSLSSRPAVADGTLVIGAHVTNKVHAVDVISGEEQWAFTADGNVDADPTIVDGVVYIGSGDGIMHALNLDDGSIVWQQDLEGKIGSGALVHDNLVVVGAGEGEVWALDRADGTPKWSAVADGPINTTPAVASRGGDGVIVVGATLGGLHVFDPTTGDRVDQVQVEGGIWFSDPLVLDRNNGEGQEVWIGSSAQDQGFLNRIDLETGELHKFATQAGVGTNPALTVDGSTIIAGNDAGDLFAVDRTTVGEVWRQSYANTPQIKGSPIVVGDVIYFGTHGKELISVNVLDGSERWRFSGEQIFGLSGPVVVDNQLFVGNDSGTVYRFDL